MEEKIISYKGFDKDLKCRGYQYEVGGEYEAEGKIKACKNGFHACEMPLDVFKHYAPAGNRFCVVEQSGDLSRDSDDSKVASRKIKINAEIGIPGLVKAQIEWVKSHTTSEFTDAEKATAGDYGAATAGYSGAATAGDYGAATAGYSGAAAAGYYGAATAGNYGAATAGYSGAATAGNSGAATAGDRGFALSGGKSAVGENGVAVAKGEEPMAKGGDGATLVLIKTDDEDRPVLTKTIIVGGKYLPDVWYTIRNNRVVKA